MSSKKNGKREWPTVDSRKRPPTARELHAENCNLKRDLMAAQQVITILCLRDARIRCEPEEVKALDGYDHELNFRKSDDGGIIVEHTCEPRQRHAKTA